MPLTEAEIRPSGMSYSLLQIQTHGRDDNLSKHSFLLAPKVGSTTCTSLQGPGEMGTSHHAPFADKLRDKRALMRLIKITRLVLLSLQMQEAVGSCPRPSSAFRQSSAAEPCPGHQQHQVLAPKALLPRQGAREDDCHLCEGESQDRGLVPGTVRKEPGQSPMTGTDKYNHPPWQWPPRRCLQTAQYFSMLRSLFFQMPCIRWFLMCIVNPFSQSLS